MCQTFRRRGKPSSLVLFYSTKFRAGLLCSGSNWNRASARRRLDWVLRAELTPQTQWGSTDQAEGTTKAKAHRTFESGVFGELPPLVLTWSTGWPEDEAAVTQTPGNRESHMSCRDLIVLDSVESKCAIVS